MIKIDYATDAMRAFARVLHGPDCEGAVFSVGNTFRVDQPFTGSLALIDQALLALAANLKAGIRRGGRGEGTALNDSLSEAVSYVCRHADSRRPSILVCCTDGKDNRSGLFRTPRRIGQDMRDRFTRIPGNFAFLVGCGGDIDRHALTLIGEAGGFPAVLLDQFSQLRDALARLAVKVTRALQRTTVTGPGYSVTRTTPGLLLESRPLQYALLLDRSGSMAEEG
jgi:hypothetical protein